MRARAASRRACHWAVLDMVDHHLCLSPTRFSKLTWNFGVLLMPRRDIPRPIDAGKLPVLTEYHQGLRQ